MSIAHELGHLVMHQPLTIGVGDVEGQAQRFAGNFLLPENSLTQDLQSPVTLETFVNLKTKWRVSIQALIVRAHELQIISDRKYHYLFSKLAARGWPKREPLRLDVPMERPRALRQTAELIYGFPIKYHKMVTDVRMHESFVRQIVEMHAGRSKGAASGKVTEQQTPTQKSASVVSFPIRPQKK
jgi:Zn-dependent peptidase ImmA (M78 family)